MNQGEGLEEQTEEEREKELGERTWLLLLITPSAHSVHPCVCRAACGFQSYFTFHVILRTAWEVDSAALLSPSAHEETNMQRVQLSDGAREWNLSAWTEDGPCLQIHARLC